MTSGFNKITKVCCVTILVLIGIIIVTPLSLTKVANRPNPYTLSRSLKSEIKQETAGMTAHDIRSYSIKKTASILSFSINNDIANGNANCVGYAQVCASICNYAFTSNGINASAKPVVGYVNCCGINLCNILKWCMPTTRSKNFVKDHDFVEFYIEGQTVYADASLYDIMWKDCETTTIN